MPIKPVDLVSLAKKLDTIGVPKAECTAEVTVRASTGRAYYAAFHALQAAIREATNDHRFDCDHSKLPIYLKSSGNADLFAIGKALEGMKEARREADYELGIGFSKTKNVLYVALAENIISQHSTLVAAMRKSKVKPEGMYGYPKPGRR